jgi:hypothetical protein
MDTTYTEFKNSPEDLQAFRICGVPDLELMNFVVLEHFSRYRIYPTGVVFDTLRKKLIRPNREGNFAMLPDTSHPKFRFNEMRNCVAPRVENIISVIRDMVRQEIPGFEKELPENYARDLYAPLQHYGQEENIRREDLGSDLPKKLYHLEAAHMQSTELMCSASFLELSIDSQASIQKDFKDSLDRLEEFKSQYPQWIKWDKWRPKKGDILHKFAIRQEEDLLKLRQLNIDKLQYTEIILKELDKKIAIYEGQFYLPKYDWQERGHWSEGTRAWESKG